MSDYESPGSLISNSSGELSFSGINGLAKLQSQNTNLNQGSRNQYSKFNLNRSQTNQASYRRQSNNFH